MTLKQQIKDAKLLLGLNPGCRIVCKRKTKTQAKTEVKTPVQTSLEKTVGLLDDELKKAEKANFIIRTEKARQFERDSEHKKVEKTEKEILKIVEDTIKNEILKNKHILPNTEEPKVEKSKKVLHITKQPNINILGEHKEEKEQKEKTLEEELDELQRLDNIRRKEVETDKTIQDILNEMQKQDNIIKMDIEKLNNIGKEDDKVKEEKILKAIENETIKDLKLDLEIYKNRIEELKENEEMERRLNALKNRGIRNEKDKIIEKMNIDREILAASLIGINDIREEERIKKELDKIDKYLADTNGSGKVGTGMTDQEIDHIMKDEPYYQNCISADEINTLKPHKKMEFIINTDVKAGPGKHWCACFIDVDGEKEIDYYDPLADDPTERFRYDIQKYIIDKLDPKSLLKFKINKVIDQRSDTDTCGLMCINFLRKRNDGVSFKDATGYKEPHINKTKQFEKEARDIRAANGFGYI